ncbi:hypothetical protein DPMN_176229 [Dreissena polymorpha]|uniref:Uncharacterized protein n=1 Tax=Dreissena polymorpha TaxID=45954 RepID=A0A9D4E9Q1_DREPO|nr:hypothetical protein DPMN_176229 [Dreissena polymorpha]
MRFLPGFSYVITTTIPSSYHVLILPCPRHVSFEHFQYSPTSFTSMKTVPRAKPCLLRRRYVVHVRTASWHIFEDVVRTWPSVTGVLEANYGSGCRV